MDAEAGLTVRIDCDTAVVSLDDGSTSRLSGPAVGKIRRLAESAGSPPAGVLTAPALATLAEARRLRPMLASSPPALGGWSGSTRRRIERQTSTVVDEAMTARRSIRRLGRCGVEDLGSVLYSVARVTCVRPDPGGGHEPLRPVPSAGARHPIDVVVAASCVDGLKPGWWRFDPWCCELVKVEVPVGADVYLERLIEVNGAEAPGAAMVLVASFSRTLARYPTGSSLVWRDAGVMAGYLHLSASSRGLASCILSPVGVAFPKPTHDGICDVGCVAVGEPLDEPSS